VIANIEGDCGVFVNPSVKVKIFTNNVEIKGAVLLKSELKDAGVSLQETWLEVRFELSFLPFQNFG
tara:strand:- start:969 stop:1166 length:198 start_codon:yes stop_codon:yes gene_type:complete